jgi:hypothetical protein
MPQIVVAVLIGAGISAGLKWIAKEMVRAADETRVAHRETGRDNRGSAPKDLGALEWDAKRGVYRPAGKRSS